MAKIVFEFANASELEETYEAVSEFDVSKYSEVETINSELCRISDALTLLHKKKVYDIEDVIALHKYANICIRAKYEPAINWLSAKDDLGVFDIYFRLGIITVEEHLNACLNRLL